MATDFRPLLGLVPMWSKLRKRTRKEREKADYCVLTTLAEIVVHTHTGVPCRSHPSPRSDVFTDRSSPGSSEG